MIRNNGWIKLHRTCLEHPVFQDVNLWKTFCYCLLRANHKPNKVLWDGGEIVLQPGQFITGRSAASKDLKFKSVMWDRKRDVLKKLRILNIETNNRFTLITIINWKKYQSIDVDGEQPSEQQMNNKRTTDEQQMNTDKNDKNEKNEEKTPLGGKKTPPKKETNPDIRKFIDRYKAYHDRTHANPLDITGGKDAVQVQRLLKTYGFDRLCVLGKAFLDGIDPWANEHGFGIGIFKVRANFVANQLDDDFTPAMRFSKGEAI